ncbi:MAG: RDD family protein, partial [Vicinamibacteria bacterium]
TMVNGDRVLSEQTLNDGDLIAIGSARLLFNVESSVAAPAPPPPGALATQPMPIRPVPPVPSAASSASAAARAGLSCLSCGEEASPFDQFCRQCGDKLPDSAVKQVACKSCHAVVMLPAKFCGSCGKVLLSEASRRVAPSESGSPPGPPAFGGGAEAPVAKPAIATRTPPPPRPSLNVGVSGPRSMAGGAVSGALSKVSGAPAPHVESDASSSPVRRTKSSPRAADHPSVRPQAASGEPAGFWIRLAAYSIDTAIVSLPVLVASCAWAFWLLEQGEGAVVPELTPRVFLLPIVGGAASLVLSIVYPVYFWALRGTTPGKRLFGLRVLGMNGETPIGWQRAMMRLIGYMINGMVMGIGFLLIAVSEDKRGLHDRLADTRVLRRS